MAIKRMKTNYINEINFRTFCEIFDLANPRIYVYTKKVEIKYLKGIY